jgi:hypothetical protein
MAFGNHLLGIFLLTFIVAVNLLIIGIESIVHGVLGKRNLASSVSSAITSLNDQ